LGDQGLKWRVILNWIVENISVGTATGYGSEVRGWIPSREQGLSLLHSVQTDSGVSRAPYTVGTENDSPGDKAVEA
jgi:hypothetical protein